VGPGSGPPVGEGDGDSVGDSDGDGEGVSEGDSEGEGDSDGDGDSEGDGDSDGEGDSDGDGDSEGEGEGVSDGEGDGVWDGDGLGLGDLEDVGFGVGVKPVPPKNVEIDPKNPPGSTSLVADWPETSDERESELPGPLGRGAAGETEGAGDGVDPVWTAPARATTWWSGHVATATPMPTTSTAAAPNFIQGKLERSPHQ
jgi:hypothetical protein